jgi:hypothetical protein
MHISSWVTVTSLTNTKPNQNGAWNSCLVVDILGPPQLSRNRRPQREKSTKIQPTSSSPPTPPLIFRLGECPCVATERYNTTITYVQMCVILLWEKIWACTNTLFLPLTCNRVVNLCIYKKEKNVRSTSLPVKGGWDPPNNRITSMLLNKKSKPQTHSTPKTNPYDSKSNKHILLIPEFHHLKKINEG